MASKSSTTTLFSTYKASKIHRNYSRNGTNSSRYVVGSVGKACGKHIRFGGSGSGSSGRSCVGSNHSRANVAIATQVLNPSAIGGSLKNRRFVEHFGPKEDDEVSFLSSKSRVVCSKVCFYGISIGVTLIMITGLIVAVGYMQSEKDRIATRPVKLAQGQDFQSSTTHQPPAILFGTTTTPNPTGDSDNEIPTENDDDDMDEISVDDPPPPPPPKNWKNGIFNFKVSTSPDSTSSSFEHQHHHHLGDDSGSANDDENNISDEYHHSTKPQQGDNPYRHNDDGGEDELNTSPEEDLHHEIAEDDIDPPEVERPFSEVRVKPPSDFKFSGISFEIPIYRVNTTSTTTETVSSATPTPTATATTDVVDDNGELHPNNDNGLGEIETESGRSSASLPPTLTTDSNSKPSEGEKTKGLETSINHSDSNSGPNFTSLIDSQEKIHNEGERGEVLFSDLNREDYANAKKHNQNPSHSLVDSSSGSLLDLDLNSQDLTQTKHFSPSHSGDTFNLNILSHYNPNSGRYNPNPSLNKDDGIIGKTSSRFSAKNQHDKTLHQNANNDEDFDIGETITSTVATLQTDIFDADEFQTSASEDSEIDAESDDKEHNASPITSTPTLRPNKNKNKNNGNKELTTPRSNSKGGRRAKIHRPTTPSPYPDIDYEIEDETPNVKTNGRIKDGKKLSLRPNKKFSGKVNGFGIGENNFKQNIQPDLGITSEGATSPGSGEEIPDLNYKVDFARFIPTTPSPTSSVEQPSDGGDNIEYQPPNHSKNPYPNFNFLPPPPEHHKPFDLEEYLNKHAKKTGTTGSSSDPDSSSQPSTSTNLDLSSIAEYQSYKVDTTSSPLLYTASSGSGGGNAFDTSSSGNLFPQQDNQFSKRTFYNLEPLSPQNSNTNENSFAHLLGPQPPSNNFGLTSATGATLNLFQPQASYNFEGGAGNFQSNSGGGGSINNYNIPTFNALSAAAQSNAQHGFSVDANGAFSLISPSNLPYPNIPMGGGNINYGGGGGAGGGSNLGRNNYQNAYSFNNEPISSSKNLVLTTGNGQVPTYNTITQGIHLLTLLSGRGGSSDGDNNNGYDQLSSGSSNYQTIAEPDIQQGQISSLTGVSNNYNTGVAGFGSNLNFNNGGNWKNSGLNSGFQSYTQDFFPTKNFKNSENDQDSSASATAPSFRRSIILKASNLNIDGSMNKAIQSQNWGSPTPSSASAIDTRLSSPYQSLISSKINDKATSGSTPSTQPKSLSIRILSSKSHKPKLMLTPSSSSPKTVDSSELESLAPKSRKRLMGPEPDVDMDVGESRHIFTNSRNNPITTPTSSSSSSKSRSLSGSTSTSTSTRTGRHHPTIGGASVKGLKSGFFN